MSRSGSRNQTLLGKRLPLRSFGLLAAILILASTVYGATWYDSEFTPGYWQSCLKSQEVINAGSTPAGGLSATGDSAYVVSGLIPIDRTSASVLTTTYTDYTGYSRNGGTNAVVIGQNQSVWVTPGTTLYDRVVGTDKTASGDMDQRVRQVLGLPSSSTADRIVEMWVTPTDMFRPARDPNMLTTVSPTEFTSFGDAYLHLPDAFKYDATGTLLSAEDAYQNYTNWLDAQVANAYTINADGTTATDVPYPATFMGYTYDSSKEDGTTTSGSQIAGLSEYVIQGKAWDPGSVPSGLENTSVVVQGVFSTSSYAAIVRAADGVSIDGFNVTGTVDTIWAGEKYYQIGDDRIIFVQSSGKIEQGIEVVSEGYEILNDGSIAGPGKNFDPSLYSGATHRDSTILLHEGGTILNFGTISGESLVIDAGTGTAGTTTFIGNAGSIIANPTISGSVAILATTGGVAIENYHGLIIGDITLGDTTADSITTVGGTIIGNVTFNGNVDDSFVFDSGTGVTSTLVGNISGIQTVQVTSGIAALNGTIQNNLSVAEGAGIEVARTGSISALTGVPMLPHSPILTIGGDLTMAAATVSDPGAAYNVHIYKPAENAIQSSQIQVGGTASLGIGSQIDVDINQDSDTPIRAGDTCVIMTATGGVTDSGATYKSDSAFLAFDHAVTGSGTQLSIQLRQPTSFESVAVGENQKAVAAALDADHESGSGSFAVMTNSLLFSTADEFRQSTNTLAPMPYFAIERVSRRTTQDLAAGLSDYLRSRRSAMRRQYGTSNYRSTESPVTPEEMRASLNNVAGDDYVFGSEARTVDYESNGLDYDVVRPQSCGWGFCSLARPFGTYFAQKSTADQTGFEAKSGGVQITFDRARTSNLLFGWEFDYASSAIDFKSSMGEATLDLFRVGPYLSWFDDRKFIDLSVSYGYNGNTIRRNANYTDHATIARREFDAHDVSVYLGMGRDFDWYGYNFSPEMSLQYIYYNRDRFTEQHAAGSACELATYNGSSLRMMVGARLNRMFLTNNGCLIVPEFNAGWAHEFLGDNDMFARFAGGITPFSLNPGTIYRDSAYFGGSLSYMPTDGLTIAGRYRGEISDGGPFHASELSVTLSY